VTQAEAQNLLKTQSLLVAQLKQQVELYKIRTVHLELTLAAHKVRSGCPLPSSPSSSSSSSFSSSTVASYADTCDVPRSRVTHLTNVR
jgi:hypothetical protein